MPEIVMIQFRLRLKEQGIRLAGLLVVWILLGQFLYRAVFIILMNGTVRTLDGPKTLWSFTPEQAPIWQVWACSTLGCIMIYFLLKALPLRMGKGMFICAAGAREKTEYMKWQLLLKTAVSFLLLCAVTALSAGTLFLGGGTARNLIQLVLWLFLLLNINLRIGSGDEGRPLVDDKGYMIYAKEEEINNVYGFCFLLTQIIVFYGLPFYSFFRQGSLTSMRLPEILIWLCILLSDAALTACCLPGILKKAASYEKVYRQVPVHAWEESGE